MNFFRKPPWFFIAVVLLHFVYFVCALHYGRIYNGDSFEYIYEAVNIKDHGFFYSANMALPITEEYMTLRTPGYPLFILFIYLFSINNWTVILLQNLVSVFSIIHVRKTFMLLGYNNKYDGWLFLLLLFYPSQLVYANLMAPDIILQALTVIYFRYAILFLKTKKAIHVLYMSLALIAGLFVKPVLYPFAIIHLLMIGTYAAANKINFKRIIIGAVLPLCCILIYSYGNKVRTGKFHFSSIQSFNAIYYYARYVTDKVSDEAGAKYIENERAEVAKLPTFKQRYDRANNRGISLLRTNFGSYMLYHFGKAGQFFLETGRGELDEFTGKLTLGKVYAGQSRKFTTVLREDSFPDVIKYIRQNSTVVFALMILLGNILKIVGTVLFIIHRRVSAILKWFIALFLAYFALITGPISNAHYTMPVSLILMCCALTGYFYIFNKNTSTTHA